MFAEIVILICLEMENFTFLRINIAKKLEEIRRIFSSTLFFFVENGVDLGRFSQVSSHGDQPISFNRIFSNFKSDAIDLILYILDTQRNVVYLTKMTFSYLISLSSISLYLVLDIAFDVFPLSFPFLAQSILYF